jgi:hypothetical protein
MAIAARCRSHGAIRKTVGTQSARIPTEPVLGLQEEHLAAIAFS